MSTLPEVNEGTPEPDSEEQDGNKRCSHSGSCHRTRLQITRMMFEG
jgi:hypothetical protein